MSDDWGDNAAMLELSQAQDRIAELESKLDATASALTVERAQKKEIGERLLATESRLDSVRRFAKERINITKDMGQPGEATGWLYVLRLVDGVVENLCPK